MICLGIQRQHGHHSIHPPPRRSSISAAFHEPHFRAALLISLELVRHLQNSTLVL